MFEYFITLSFLKTSWLLILNGNIITGDVMMPSVPLFWHFTLKLWIVCMWHRFICSECWGLSLSPVGSGSFSLSGSADLFLGVPPVNGEQSAYQMGVQVLHTTSVTAAHVQSTAWWSWNRQIALFSPCSVSWSCLYCLETGQNQITLIVMWVELMQQSDS